MTMAQETQQQVPIATGALIDGLDPQMQALLKTFTVRIYHKIFS